VLRVVVEVLGYSVGEICCEIAVISYPLGVRNWALEALIFAVGPWSFAIEAQGFILGVLSSKIGVICSATPLMKYPPEIHKKDGKPYKHYKTPLYTHSRLKNRCLDS